MVRVVDDEATATCELEQGVSEVSEAMEKEAHMTCTARMCGPLFAAGAAM